MTVGTLDSQTGVLPVGEETVWLKRKNYLKIRLQYYADDDERDCWESEFEDDEMPPKKPLPYGRDRHLPVPSYGRSRSEDIC